MQLWKKETQKNPGRQVMEERVTWGEPAGGRDPLGDRSLPDVSPRRINLLRSLMWRVMIGLVLLALVILLYEAAQ